MLDRAIYSVIEGCRSCGGKDLMDVLDLGVTPLADRLLTAATIDEPEPTCPLTLAFCPDCSLVQIRETVDPERIKPWLMKVTRNTCLDRLRRRKPETELTEVQAVEEHGPMAGAQQGELGRWLKRSIEGLKEPYRTLVVLRDIQQHSYEEVAGATELSLTQVKVYLHRARKQLREQLAEVRP